MKIYKLILMTSITIMLCSLSSYAEETELQLQVAKAQEQLKQMEAENGELMQELTSYENEIIEKRQLLQELEEKIDAIKLEHQ